MRKYKFSTLLGSTLLNLPFYLGICFITEDIFKVSLSDIFIVISPIFITVVFLEARISILEDALKDKIKELENKINKN